MHASQDRLCALTNSMPGAIRWRFRDYEQMLRKQLQLLAQPLHVIQQPRVALPGARRTSSLRTAAE